MVTWQKLLIVLTGFVVAVLSSIGILAIVVWFYLTSAKADTSGYNEFVSACTEASSKESACMCIARNLKAKDVSDDQARHLAEDYKNFRAGKEDTSPKVDDETVELEWFELQLAEECLKDPNFKVQE